MADDGPGGAGGRPPRQPASRQRGGDRPVQPKRYLWDEDPREDSWRFNSEAGHGEQAPVATGVAFTTLVNDAGDAIHSVDGTLPGADMLLLPSIRALYARRNLMSFVLAGISCKHRG